jgi:hypothetical protein
MPETSATKYGSTPLPGRADADIRPTRERYYSLDRPLPAALEEDEDRVKTRAELEEEGFGDMDFAEPAQSLPTSPLARKELPLTTGLLDYFPAALIAVAGLSRVGNEQHNPGEPMHWARGKSGDEADALLRHLVDRGTIDTDGIRHSTKVAWRALAMLQKELEGAGLAPLSRGSR